MNKINVFTVKIKFVLSSIYPSNSIAPPFDSAADVVIVHCPLSSAWDQNSWYICIPFVINKREQKAVQWTYNEFVQFFVLCPNSHAL